MNANRDRYGERVDQDDDLELDTCPPADEYLRIDYVDNTGETAVWRVMAERGQNHRQRCAELRKILAVARARRQATP